MEIEVILAPAGIHRRHPELHHYTTVAGLEGILRSRTLWATHFQGLNDRSEVTHLKTELTKALGDALVPVVDRLRKCDRRILGESRAAGGPTVYARNHSRTLVESCYSVAFTGKGVPAMAIPYIVSFCSHAGDHAYEQANGLLSQWRGYGQDGGCCIVFDTLGLVDLLRREWDGFYWIGNGIDEVVYASHDISVVTRYGDLVIELAKTVEDGIRNHRTSAPLSPSAMPQFLNAATRFKHQGFKEEREVRIVAIPGSAETAELTSRSHPEFTRKPIKLPREHPTENRGRPYITIFSTLDAQLPIKRIIVGPSRHQDENLRRAVVAGGHALYVVRSETPFV
jgi:hypothetical protein